MVSGHMTILHELQITITGKHMTSPILGEGVWVLGRESRVIHASLHAQMNLTFSRTPNKYIPTKLSEKLLDHLEK